MDEDSTFNPKTFVDRQVKEIQKTLGDTKAIIACSGGVDSTSCAVLTHRAVGENLVCAFIDTGFMRLGEPKKVVDTLKKPPFSLPIKLIRAEERFLKTFKELTDAEEKRKAFRNTFYSVLSDVAKAEKCQFLVQGTILPDIIETTKGIKTQHNVLEQMKINTEKVYGFKVIEPLATLYKYQVREVATYLGIPSETSQRQPFPGPGLSVRVIGEITPEKLNVVKKATASIEEKLESIGGNQYFAAAIDDEKVLYSKALEVGKGILSILRRGDVDIIVRSLRDRATGIKAGLRQYGKIVLVDIKGKNRKCVELPAGIYREIQKKIMEVDDEISRVLYRVTDTERKGKWIIAIRAVETRDFMTAIVSNIPWKILSETGNRIMDISPDVSAVYFDITPKPPSSIEFE